MKYPKYSEYKDSGVEWIGIIPKGWEVKKLSRCLSRLESGNREVGGGNQLKDGVFSIGGEHIDWEGNINLTNPKYIKESFYFNLNSGKVKEEDILLVKDGATIGKIAYVKELPVKQVAINEHVFLLRTNKLLYSKFLYYFLYSKIGQTQILSNVRGAAQGGLNSSFVQRLYISIPPLLVQKNISSFLDNEIERLSKLIYKENNIISLLKEKRQAIITNAVTKGLEPNVPMKDSGIEWVGQIPEHWKLTKLKSVCHFNYGDSLPAEDRLEGEFPVFGSNGIIDYNNLSNTGSPTIIIGRKGSYGKLFYSSLPGFAIDTTFFVNEKTSKVNLKWLYYTLAILHLDNNSLDTGVPGLSRENAYEEIIVLPSNEEQFLISNFLDSKTNKIDILISKQHNMIELLKEYKTSLITQVVTGKIDVRGVTPPTTPSDSLH